MTMTKLEKEKRDAFRQEIREKYGVIYYTLPSGRLHTRRYNPHRCKICKGCSTFEKCEGSNQEDCGRRINPEENLGTK